MITLIAPRVGCNAFIIQGGFLIGPVSTSPEQEWYEEVSTFRSAVDSIIEEKGIFHENAVVHCQGFGEIEFAPYLNSVSYVPLHDSQTDYPDNVRLSTSKTGYVSAKCGLATEMSVSHSRIMTSHYMHDTIVGSLVSNLGFSIIHAEATETSTYPVMFFKREYTFSSRTSSSITFSVKHTEYKAGSAVGPVWNSLGDDITGELLLGLTETLPVSYSSTSTITCTLRIPYSEFALVLSPSQLKIAAEAMLGIMSFGNFPIQDTPYGDLAMRASEKINANRVNMLEFLSDLRHPMSMIPNLRRLTTLKGISGNFLSVDFGLLPTIDDIQSIVNACRRISPYLDRDNNEIYTSASSDHFRDDSTGMLYTLEQHLKLAIGKEDSDLDAIIARFDSMGILPTMENIWDLVPYSFLVDWLVDVGGFLERADSRLRLTRLPIQYVTMSRKETVQRDFHWSPQLPYRGYLRLEHYHRWVSDQCPAPPLSLHATIDGFDHWLESAALLLQRRK